VHRVAAAAAMGGTDMVSKCANYWCSASHHEGEVFRVEFELGGPVGERQLKTVPLWLCALCARDMTPPSEVAANTTAKMRLSPEERMQVFRGRSAVGAIAA
jgi:hypothetical protein